MPNWNNVLREIGQLQKSGSSAIDITRRKYLKLLQKRTKRNTIAYYSGWLHRPAGTPNVQVGDDDMNAFMAAVHQLDRTKGLDLILHTPGGDIAATESIVNYLWTMFDKDIRVIVPQMAMSAGTMIACAARQIVMGKQSSLGPIDPQIMGMPAQAILEEFQLAIDTIKVDPASTPLMQQIVSRYHPSFLIECVQAIDWSKKMVKKWLTENMLTGVPNAEAVAEGIVGYLSDHKSTATHSRHLPLSKCEEINLKIVRLEDDQALQDLVLTVHHAFIHTFSLTPAIKIVENHLGVATILIGMWGNQSGPQAGSPVSPEWKPPAPVLPALPKPDNQPPADTAQIVDPTGRALLP